VAITECGTLATNTPPVSVVNAFRPGDGSMVAVTTLAGFHAGATKQEEGIRWLCAQLKQDPATGGRYLPTSRRNVQVPGLFVFAWDEPTDSSFGLVNALLLRPGYASGVVWTDSGNPYMPSYVPLGNPALRTLAEAWKASALPTRVVLRQETPTLRLQRVEMCYPTTSQPRTEVTFTSHPDGGTPAYSVVAHALRLGGDAIGKAVWEVPAPGVEVPIDCLGAPERYWVRASWGDGTTKGPWVQLTKVPGASGGSIPTKMWKRQYTKETDCITVTFGPYVSEVSVPFQWSLPENWAAPASVRTEVWMGPYPGRDPATWARRAWIDSPKPGLQELKLNLAPGKYQWNAKIIMRDGTERWVDQKANWVFEVKPPAPR